jgi:hypothetical protein
MSSNIYSSNDDDIFEDYVEPSSSNDYSNTPEDLIDKSFPDIDSPFSSLLRSSSVKVNFGDAFYNAAHEWIASGYREANTSAILTTLSELTEGRFLYVHRLTSSAELLQRKKTIIRFLKLLLNNDSLDGFVKVISDHKEAIEDKLKFNEEYFNMFFRSFYNLQIHTYKCEYAVYISLCEMLDHPIDQSLADPFSEDITVTSGSKTINDLYMQYFEKDKLGDLIEKNIEQILSQKES